MLAAGVVVAAAAVATGADTRRIGGLFAAALATVLAAAPARAQPTELDLRAARQLFVEAERDEAAQRWSEALEKLQRVSQVKFTAGVHFHVALCQEHLGKLAAALDGYTIAENQARAENAQDVLRLVGKRIADIGPRVPRLTVRVVPQPADTTVTLDGVRLTSAVLATAIPVDPGEHRVEATAAGRTPATATVTLQERDSQSVELKLPAVAPAPAPAPASVPAPAPAPASAPEPSPDATGPTHTAAIVTTAGAVVLAGGGLAAFLLASGAHSDAVAQCASVVSTATDACDSKKNAVRGWDFTAGGAWIAAATVGTIAVVLWVRPSSPRPAQASARVVLGPGSVGLGGSF